MHPAPGCYKSFHTAQSVIYVYLYPYNALLAGCRIFTSDKGASVNFPALDFARLMPLLTRSAAVLLRQALPDVYCRGFVQRSRPALHC